MNRVSRTLIVVAIVALIAAVWFALRQRGEAPAPGPAQPQLPLATVREGSIERSVQLAGRVGAPAGTQTKLAFTLSGAVQSIAVRLGEHVEAGDVLAQLDATSYALAAGEAQASANAARAGSNLASVDRISVKTRVDEAELARQQRLYHAGVVALRDVQAAQGTLAADRAEAQSAELELQQAQAQSRAAGMHAAGANYDVARTTLRAPSAGTVVGIFVQAGQTVDSTIPVVAIASDRQGVATLDVPVSQLARISQGDPAHVRSADARWEGRVAGVAPAVDPATGLAIVSITGVPSGTPAGTPIDATVVVGAARGLIVPRDAVIEDPQSGAQLVFVRQRASDGSYHFAARTVTVDVRDSRYARVTSGLRAGERVAAQGAIDLLAPAGGE